MPKLSLARHFAKIFRLVQLIVFAHRMAPRRLLFCLDESKQSIRALEWTLIHLRRASDELHLVTVLPPLVYNVYPVAPVATGAALATVTHQWEAQRLAEEHQAAGKLCPASFRLLCHLGVLLPCAVVSSHPTRLHCRGAQSRCGPGMHAT